MCVQHRIHDYCTQNLCPCIPSSYSDPDNGFRLPHDAQLRRHWLRRIRRAGLLTFDPEHKDARDDDADGDSDDDAGKKGKSGISKLTEISSTASSSQQSPAWKNSDPTFGTFQSIVCVHAGIFCHVSRTFFI